MPEARYREPRASEDQAVDFMAGASIEEELSPAGCRRYLTRNMFGSHRRFLERSVIAAFYSRGLSHAHRQATNRTRPVSRRAERGEACGGRLQPLWRVYDPRCGPASAGPAVRLGGRGIHISGASEYAPAGDWRCWRRARDRPGERVLDLAAGTGQVDPFLGEIRRVLARDGGVALLNTVSDWGGASWAHEQGALVTGRRPVADRKLAVLGGGLCERLLECALAAGLAGDR